LTSDSNLCVEKSPPRAYGTVVCPSTDELEHLLRAARPVPPADFARALENALLPRPAPVKWRDRWAPRWRLAVAATGSAIALLAVAAVLGIAGALPFSVGAGKNAEAGQDCRTVMVDRRERQAYFVRGRNGRVHLRFRTALVRRPVTRCR
jgi:hypothetical protein